MFDIVIAEFMAEDAIAGLQQSYRVHYDPLLGTRREALRAKVREARALIVRNQTRVDDALLAAAPGLVAVGRLGVGLDNIDLEACAARGVKVFPATGANAQSVAEYVMAGLFMLMRGAYQASRRMLAGEWPRSQLVGREINGRHLGLVGFGGIARLVADKAKALGMRVSASDPLISIADPVWEAAGVTPLGLNDLLGQVDALSLHVPLTESTRLLIDADAIARMQTGAVLINTARGGVLDETALAAALTEGHLAGALLDVFAAEPLTADNPFHGVPNLILTPHIAGVTDDANQRVSRLTAENVDRALKAVRP